MKWIVRIISCIFLLIILAIAGIFASGNGKLFTIIVAFVFNQPDHPFNPNDAVSAPDYALPGSWATLPQRYDLADYRPAGIAAPMQTNPAPVDVFFIHPTGFLKGSSWTYTMKLNSTTEENTQWTMANQASAFNGCCDVYAPRYRQASVFSYFNGPELREEILSFVYQDIEASFTYYLEHYNNGRPFIIAGHSQGSHHGLRLLQNVIDNSPLAKQMVVAFLIGGGIDKSAVENMQNIHICNNASDVNCLVHWDTYNDAVIENEESERANNVCVNPLSWENEGGLSSKENHAGAVYPSGEFQFDFSGSDAATGVIFEALAAAQPKLVDAQCKNGMLFISDQSGTPFESIAEGLGGGIYHNLDYPIFYMDIRENAILRVNTYLER